MKKSDTSADIAGADRSQKRLLVNKEFDNFKYLLSVTRDERQITMVKKQLNSLFKSNLNMEF